MGESTCVLDGGCCGFWCLSIASSWVDACDWGFSCVLSGMTWLAVGALDASQAGVFAGWDGMSEMG